MDITFLGATQTVTGSKYQITADHQQFLVDCGLFQGYKELRLRNWAPLPIIPKTVQAIVLTHAHIDHSGYIPLLVKNGFTGKIYCSPATYNLCEILLPDSGFLQEEEAYFANKHGYSKHKPALPLYTRLDAEKCLSQFEPVHFGTEYKLSDSLSFQLHHAGHILGASMVQLRHNHTHLLFSGDMGRPHDPIMKPPAQIQQTDYLVLESTYGNKTHEKENPLDQLEQIINHTINRGGSIIIPAFAVGRAQNMLYFIYQLKKANRIPDIPVFLDSPMATDATKLLCKYAPEHRLSFNESIAVCKNVTYVKTPQESEEIDHLRKPIIIISASGMATGGRVLHHLKAFLPHTQHTVLLTGFQAGGTRGDRLLRGEPEIKIHGEIIPVKAEILSLSNTSAHADSDEMMQWLRGFVTPPRKTFLTHGEIESSLSLQEKIIQELEWTCEIPSYLEKVVLD